MTWFGPQKEMRPAKRHGLPPWVPSYSPSQTALPHFPPLKTPPGDATHPAARSSPAPPLACSARPQVPTSTSPTTPRPATQPPRACFLGQLVGDLWPGAVGERLKTRTLRAPGAKESLARLVGTRLPSGGGLRLPLPRVRLCLGVWGGHTRPAIRGLRSPRNQSGDTSILSSVTVLLWLVSPELPASLGWLLK